MNRHELIWKRLTRAARLAAPEPGTEAPFGFATRVVGRWSERTGPSLLSVWERLAGRVLAGACGVLLVSLCASFVFHPAPTPDVTSLPDRAIELVLAP